MPRRDPIVDIKPGEEKWSQVQHVLIPGGTGAIWKPRRYDTFAKEAYLTNVIAYRCIDEVAKAVESVDWKLNTRKKDGSVEEVTDHPLIDLMYRPNPEQTWGELAYRHTAFSLISGNAYMERIGPTTGPNAGQVKEMWSHRPDRMHLEVNPDTGVRRKYVYQGPSGRPAEWPVDPITGASDIWHMKFFHPLNDWYGAGPVEPTSREIDTSNEAMEWNKNLLQNQGRPGMIIAFKGNIGQTEYNRLERTLREKYGGPKNTGKHMIIEGEGATVQPYGWSPLDMDYIEGNRELARRIAFGFGVPPQIIGIPGDNTYSNYEAALLAFWENTVFFYLKRFGGGMAHWMFDPKDRMAMVPNYDKLPALEPRRKAQFEKAERADFLTINEKREMAGYETYQKVLDDAEKKKDPGAAEGEDAKPKDPADVIYQSATMVALGEEPPDTGGGFGGPGDPGAAAAQDAEDADALAAGAPAKPKPDAGIPKKKPAGKKPGQEE
jgi:HK97 family phage portal protein